MRFVFVIMMVGLSACSTFKQNSHTKKFTITKAYAEELRNKIGLFKEITNTNKSVYLTFVTTFGLEPNEYAASLVQNSLTMDVLFESME